MADPVILTCCPVGAEVMRDQHPGVPYTPAEIAQASIEAVRAGASIVHLHVREDDGMPSQDPARFQETVTRIRSEVDCIIQISSGGAVTATEDERLAPLFALDPAPEMASLTMGTVNFGDEVFWNPPSLIRRFAIEFAARGIMPELEIFEPGQIQAALRLVKQGVLRGHLHFDFVLGVPGASPGTAQALLHMVAQLPAGATWTVAGIGAAELSLGMVAIALGGHVRCGFEDNVYYRKGEQALSNAQLVERMARLADESNRGVATPDQARALLHLPPRVRG
ncbi:MAG: 3-keto-5-aminohexanoate cleavage protein [bacterium]|nr:3-keto-5-aminohexanoate cleavage protein [bacterium]